jgi:cell division protein ZapA
MGSAPVELRVGGQSYRVLSSASPTELKRLAAVVDEKLSQMVPPGRAVTPQAMLLVAIALAHDVEQERERAARVQERMQERSRGALGELLREVEDTMQAAAELIDARVSSPSQVEVVQREATRSSKELVGIDTRRG